MRTGEYQRCPFCFNNYQMIIPKGGDGSAVFFPRHKRHKGFGYSFYDKEVCPGSNKEYKPEPEDKGGWV